MASRRVHVRAFSPRMCLLWGQQGRRIAWRLRCAKAVRHLAHRGRPPACSGLGLPAVWPVGEPDTVAQNRTWRVTRRGSNRRAMARHTLKRNE